MLQIIKDLYKFNRNLLGEGFNSALIWINQLIGLDIIEIPSGTKLEQWTVPDEWMVKDAWVKLNGEKIIDYKKEPLSLMVYSQPFRGTMNLEEFKKCLYVSTEKPEALSYEYSFYEPRWGFSYPKNKLYKRADEKTCTRGAFPDLKKVDKEVDGVEINLPKYKDLLSEGKYEIFIDTEFKPGKMKIGVHTIPGKSDREILLFAHLDHPYQANDNLSGVACLVDLAKKIKCDHTVKIIFCPETIGSIAYALTQDISKVDFVITLDIVGNDGDLLLQKSYDRENRLNFLARYAITEGDKGIDFRLSDFRRVIGSDEYFFNDPQVGIPGILFTRAPYPEYHTNSDTPDIIKEEKLEEVRDIVLRTIELYEKDFIPVRKFKGPMMRSKYGFNDKNKDICRDIDYLIYTIDGKKYLSELVNGLHLGFGYAYKILTALEKDGYISRVNTSKKKKQKASRKKR